MTSRRHHELRRSMVITNHGWRAWPAKIMIVDLLLLSNAIRLTPIHNRKSSGLFRQSRGGVIIMDLTKSFYVHVMRRAQICLNRYDLQ